MRAIVSQSTQDEIEERVLEFIGQGYLLTQEDLKTDPTLRQEIRRDYPGGIKALRKKLRSSQTRSPGFWQNPANIEAELNKIIEKIGHFPTQSELKTLHISAIHGAMLATGGVNSWREKLSQDIIKREDGYWDKDENVEREIIRVLEEYNLADFPSAKQLKALGLIALAAGISRSGGFPKWRARLGFDLKEKPKKYWTPESVEKEAREFYEQYGELSHEMLGKHRRFDLQVAAGRRYPGGLTTLKEKLGIEPFRKPEGYWTPEIIEEEARRFYEETGGLTLGELKRAKKGSLQSAILYKYPGSIAALKAKLGIVETVKPRKYWQDIENIKKEALEFYLSFGSLTHTLLSQNGGGGLSSAISSYYAGGIAQLKIDLRIDTDKEKPISPDQANEQLAKLVEAAK